MSNDFLLGEIGFDGKMLRKAMARKTVDYNPSIIRYLEVRSKMNIEEKKSLLFIQNSIWQRNIIDGRSLQPDVLYIPHVKFSFYDNFE